MRYLYQFFILFAILGIRIASIWNPKAKLWLEGRRNVWSRVKGYNDDSKKSIWFHCASLGEFEQARPIIEELRNNYPQKKIALSFFSSSGYEIRKNYEKADVVFYLPADTQAKVKKIIDLINPELVVFVKSEFWPNYLDQFDKKQIPVLFISSRFRPKQYLFKSYGKWVLSHIKTAKAILVQDEKSKKLLNENGYHNAILSGDSRVDRVFEIAKNSFDNKLVKAFKGDARLIIAGSSWPKDEVLIRDFAGLNPDLKFIIAPHDVDSKHTANLKKEFGNHDTVLYSELTYKNANSKRILIIDKIGILASLYLYAHIVYIGGGFTKGIHNTLEPAAFGKPIVFGPKYHKFKEAIELIDNSAAFSFKDKASFFMIMNDLLKQKDKRELAGAQSKLYIEKNLGTKDQVIQRILEILK